MIEIGLHPLGALDQELDEGSSLREQTVASPAAISAAQVRLDVPLEIFVRVALRRVGRQVEHLDLALGKPQLLAQAHGMAAQGLERIRGKLSSVDLVYGQ
jgi:hypothetical protein